MNFDHTVRLLSSQLHFPLSYSSKHLSNSLCKEYCWLNQTGQGSSVCKLNGGAAEMMS